MNTQPIEQLLTALRDNLLAQRQAMLADDLDALSVLTSAQQSLQDIYQDGLKEYFSGNAASQQEVDLLKEAVELLRTNELLARQSLDYARRMLEALDGKGKNRNGDVSPGLGFDRKV